MIKQAAFDQWWSEEGCHLPQNNRDTASAAWEACERVHKHGLVELALRCLLEGMLAANRERQASGWAPAYHDQDFQLLSQTALRLGGIMLT